MILGSKSTWHSSVILQTRRHPSPQHRCLSNVDSATNPSMLSICWKSSPMRSGTAPPPRSINSEPSFHEKRFGSCFAHFGSRVPEVPPDLSNQNHRIGLYIRMFLRFVGISSKPSSILSTNACQGNRQCAPTLPFGFQSAKLNTHSISRKKQVYDKSLNR